MKSITKLSIGLLALLNAGMSQAKGADYPWFVQVSVGAIDSTEATDQALADLNAMDHQVNSLSFTPSDNSYQVELGYRMTENWAITAGYVDFGATDFQVDIDTAYPDLLVSDVSRAAPRFGNGNTFGLMFNARPVSFINFSMDAGALMLESEYRAKVNVGTEDTPVFYDITERDSSVQWYMGAGLGVTVSKLEVGVYYRRYEIDDIGTDWLGLKLGYHF